MEDQGNSSFVFFAKRETWNQMVAHCSTQLPNEACGLLSGKQGRAETIWTMENILYSPITFEMDQQQQIRVFNSIEGQGEDLVGIYHSHPTASPYPSPFDIANANYPEVVYIIVSLANAVPEVRCFWIRENKVIPLSYYLF